MWKSAGRARLCELYPGICHTTEEKARKNLSQGKKNLSHSTVYILPKTPTHYKALTNTHITKPTHTHTTKLYKTLKRNAYRKSNSCNATYNTRKSVPTLPR